MIEHFVRPGKGALHRLIGRYKESRYYIVDDRAKPTYNIGISKFSVSANHSCSGMISTEENLL